MTPPPDLAALARKFRLVARGGERLVVASAGRSYLEIDAREALAIADVLEPPRGAPRRVPRPEAPVSAQDRRFRELEAIGASKWTSAQDEEFWDLKRVVYHQWAGSAPPWSPIVHGDDGGGYRDYLDGEPISCGTGLELQATETLPIGDGDEVDRRLATGVHVRYETTHTAKGRAVVLYGSIGNHTFTAPLQAWMRFRWPPR